MKKPVEDLLETLQASLLLVGGRLPSLDSAQISRGIGDKQVEGKVYVQPTHHEREGEISKMTTQTHEEKSSKTVKEVPPAGGTDASQALMALLEKAGSAIDAEKASKRTYGQKALDVAIPTTIVAVACVATYAGVTLVYRQWGRGALISRGMDLIEAGKLNVLDAVGQAAGQTAGHTPQHQMM